MGAERYLHPHWRAVIKSHALWFNGHYSSLHTILIIHHIHFDRPSGFRFRHRYPKHHLFDRLRQGSSSCGVQSCAITGCKLECTSECKGRNESRSRVSFQALVITFWVGICWGVCAPQVGRFSPAGCPIDGWQRGESAERIGRDAHVRDLRARSVRVLRLKECPCPPTRRRTRRRRRESSCRSIQRTPVYMFQTESHFGHVIHMFQRCPDLDRYVR